MRQPWHDDFPDVIVHATVRERDDHPCYGPAKSGDAEAAFTLADALIDNAAIKCLARLIGSKTARLLPVVADELSGFNAIPDAMAHVIGHHLKLPVVSGEIVQVNKVGHTRAPAFQRLVTPADFEGPVTSMDYVLIDDHVGLGGTLANLRGHVEGRGGRVIGMTTLTETRDARRISLRPETRDLVWRRHGDALNRLWQDQFGHGIDCLTELEAVQLCRQPSVAAIEDFLAKAAVEARRRGLETPVE